MDGAGNDRSRLFGMQSREVKAAVFEEWNQEEKGVCRAFGRKEEVDDGSSRFVA